MFFSSWITKPDEPQKSVFLKKKGKNKWLHATIGAVLWESTQIAIEGLLNQNRDKRQGRRTFTILATETWDSNLQDAIRSTEAWQNRLSSSGHIN